MTAIARKQPTYRGYHIYLYKYALTYKRDKCTYKIRASASSLLCNPQTILYRFAPTINVLITNHHQSPVTHDYYIIVTIVIYYTLRGNSNRFIYFRIYESLQQWTNYRNHQLYNV